MVKVLTFINGSDQYNDQKYENTFRTHFSLTNKTRKNAFSQFGYRNSTKLDINLQRKHEFAWTKASEKIKIVSENATIIASGC